MRCIFHHWPMLLLCSRPPFFYFIKAIYPIIIEFLSCIKTLTYISWWTCSTKSHLENGVSFILLELPPHFPIPFHRQISQIYTSHLLFQSNFKLTENLKNLYNKFLKPFIIDTPTMNTFLLSFFFTAFVLSLHIDLIIITTIANSTCRYHDFSALNLSRYLLRKRTIQEV